MSNTSVMSQSKNTLSKEEEEEILKEVVSMIYDISHILYLLNLTLVDVKGIIVCFYKLHLERNLKPTILIK